jgi:hypothetical protein
MSTFFSHCIIYRFCIDCKTIDQDFPTQNKRERERSVTIAVRGTILIIVTVALKFPRHCPFVLLAKIGWRQGRASGNEKGRMM